PGARPGCLCRAARPGGLEADRYSARLHPAAGSGGCGDLDPAARRRDAGAQQVIDIVLRTPGVSSASVYAGIDGNGFNNQSSSGQLWAIFDPFPARLAKGLTAARITAELRQRLAPITAADIRITQPAPVLGLGSAGGFRMMIEDRGGYGYAALEAAARDVADAAAKDPAITNTYVSFNSHSPRLDAEVDRDKAEMLGVPA